MAEKKTVHIIARVTEAERALFLALGGSAWIREQLKKAKGKGK